MRGLDKLDHRGCTSTTELVAPTNPLGCVAADWAGAEVTGKIALLNRGTCPFTGGTLGPSTPDLAPTTGITQDAGQALVDKLAAGPVTATLDLNILVETRRTWNVIAETDKGRSDNPQRGG